MRSTNCRRWCPPRAPLESGTSAQDATNAALRRAETTPNVPGTKAQAEAGTVPAPSGAFAPVELDLRLTIPDNLVLRGKKLRPGGPTGASLGDMNITVGGDLQIVKPANGQLLLLGEVETVRGTYEFQGRRFDLQRGGTLRFLGEPQPNPALDITATRLIPNTGVEARIRVQGTAKAPQLSLTSNPPLEESDILALIVFNRPVNELGTGERSSLAATAGGIATGFLAAPLGDSIGRALDLDLFEITTTTEEGDLGAGLTLGQQVSGQGLLQAAAAVRRAQRHRVPAGVSARRFPAPAGHRRPGDLWLGQPHRPAPRRARRGSI